MSIDAIEGLAGALDTTSQELAKAARAVDEWSRNHPPTPEARNAAQIVAGNLGAAAALLASSVDLALALEAAES